MNAREEWLVQRKEGLGGSDLGAILGLSKYRTPVDVFLDKTGRTAGQEETLQMRFGSYAEEFVAQEYTRKTGLAVQRFTTMLHHATAPILGNVDRLVIPEGQKRAAHQREIRTNKGMEAKTASAFAAFNDAEWGPEGTDQVPASYLVQCATYMALTGCELWDLAVLFGNQEVRIYNLKRDMDLEEELIARASDWWQKHVIADVAPDPVCDADVCLIYPNSAPGTIVQASENILHELDILREAKREISIQEGIADAAALVIKTAMGEAESLAWNGTTLCTWKSAKASAKTDWKSLAQGLRPTAEYIAQHTTETKGSRRFLLKEEK